MTTPSMPAGVPAHAIAAVDQARAELTELVRAAREHTEANVCRLPRTCAGEVVRDVLNEFEDRELYALAYLAVAELAALGYGLPAPDDLYNLTELGRALIDPEADDGD